MPETTCLVDDCEKPVKSRERCAYHYHKWWEENLRPLRPGCTWKNCGQTPVIAKGMCSMHYSRLTRHGDPDWTPPPPDRMALFMSKVVFGPRLDDGTFCLLWTAAKRPGGYGVFKADKPRNEQAHRWLYERWVGPIPTGMELHHLCHRPSCVNPAHMGILSKVEHAKHHAAEKGRPTHCRPKGHEYTEANTYIDPGGGIRCRACNRERNRIRYGSDPARFKMP